MCWLWFGIGLIAVLDSVLAVRYVTTPSSLKREGFSGPRHMPAHYLNSRRHRPCPPTLRSNFARDDFRAGCFSRLAFKLLPSGLSAGTRQV